MFRENNDINNQAVTIHDKNGNKLVGLVSSRSFRYNEKDCILTIGRNITDLKQKELELAKKTHELEKMILEKDKFLSILAHDLRGSIATAVNLTELMSDEKNDFSKDDFLRFSGSLNKSINSTNELLDNLLEWTGLHRGLNNFNPIKTTFADVMSQFMPYLISLAKDKKITLTNDIPDDTLFFADVHMAQTIFRNLIVNAIKFTKEQGHIRLSVQKQDNGKTIFSVSDNGIGMNAKILESLFQINAKNNRLGTNGELSTGLGLLLCNDFVEKHHGRIWVESEVDKGSTFYLTLDN